MIVLGAGIIGCEYATMFAALGCKVTLVDRKSRPLTYIDEEIGKRFVDYIQEMGVVLKPLSQVHDIREVNGLAEVELVSGDILQAETALFALGRQTNIESLNLKKAGVKLGKYNLIKVNALFQTSHEHIYAAGDVIGPPSLASTSMEQGRLAALNAFSVKTKQFPRSFSGGCILLSLKLSSTGPTEEELKKRGIHYEVGRAYFYEIARGPITGDTNGLFKLLFHSETMELLAVHIIGHGATELIHIGDMALRFRARVTHFVEHVFNYPTFAEGYRIAALNGINKCRPGYWEGGI